MDGKFLKMIATHDKPVLADFWAEWCGPCRMMAPVLKEFAGKHSQSVTVVKVDTEAQPNLSAQFGISSIPTLIVFKGGKEVHRISGAMPLAALEAEMTPYL
jgi:thioredoxin